MNIESKQTNPNMNTKQNIDTAEPLRAGWMREGKFGLMVHWIPPGPMPQKGEREMDLQRAVDAFDLDLFLRQFDESQADWMIFTIAQNSGYYASHNATLDRLLGPGHTSNRDLVMEIAKAVKVRNKRFIAYLPCIVTHAPDEVRTKLGWTTVKKAIPDIFPDDNITPELFQERYSEVIRDYALRFGTLLDGWWFDGAVDSYKYLDSYSPVFMDAARAGNPAAAVTFNDGSFSNASTRVMVKGQDYLAGETDVVVNGKIRFGRGKDAPLLDPRTAPPKFRRSNGVDGAPIPSLPHHTAPPPDSCLWHALVPIDCWWGHGNAWSAHLDIPFTPPPFQAGRMEPPVYTTADLATLVSDFKAVGGGVTFNVGIFQEGGLGPESVAQLNELAEIMEKSNP